MRRKDRIFRRWVEREEGRSYIREALNCAKLDCARARRPSVRGRGRYIVASVMVELLKKGTLMVEGKICESNKKK